MKVLNEVKAEALLSKYLQIAKSKLVKKLDEAKNIQFPIVLKIISDDALHKTEVGGVKIVNSREELEKEFLALQNTAKKKKIKLDGILLQEKLSGVECIIGIKKDSVFGHIILFGVGGIFTEILEDVSIRKCPINENDADEMIRELKSSKLFSEKGFRGKKLNTSLLKRTLVKVSEIPLKHKNIQELDINPFILNEKEGKVADARIILD